MKKKYLIPAIVLLVLCAVFVGLLLKRLLPAKAPDTIHTQEPVAGNTAAPTPTRTPKPTSEAAPEPSPEASEEPEEPEPTPRPEFTYPDFDALQAQNPDIYAWIDIPGAGISYAVLQSQTDDTFYLDHEEHGWSSANGALFTEHVYNSRDFTDPVTLIYGHHMRSGAMFGNLQTYYSSAENFRSSSDIYIILPDQELHYKIFAAVPFDGYHILYAYDFTNAKTFKSFFNNILATRVMGSNVDSECELTPDDKVIILSTCLQGNNKNRFLVMAKQVTN